LIFGVLTPIQQYFSYIMATSFSGGGSFQQYFSYIMATSFSGGRSEPSAPFFVIYKSGREPMPYR